MASPSQAPFLPWKHVASTLVGGAICLPTIMIGYMLGSSGTTITTSIAAILIGNAFLLTLSIFMAELTDMTRKNTPDLYEALLGKNMGRAMSFLLSITLAVWFGIQSQTMAEAFLLSFESILGNLASYTLLVSLGISLLLVLTSQKLDRISKVSSWAMPLMIFMLILPLIFHKKESIGQPLTIDAESHGKIFFNHISLVIAASIAAVVDLPTFLVACRTKKDMHKASICLFGFGCVVMEGIGLFLAFLCGGKGVAIIEALTLPEEVFQSIGGTLAPHIAPILTALLLLLAGWTTNSANFYSMIQTIQCFFEKTASRHVFLFGSIVACVMSQITLLHSLSSVLEIMAVPLIAGVGGIASSITFATQQHIESKALQKPLQISVIAGTIFGWVMLMQKTTLFFEPLTDTAFISCITSLFCTIQLQEASSNAEIHM